MKQNLSKHWLLMLVMAALGCGLAACSDDPENTEPATYDVEKDLLKGNLVYALDADSLDAYELPLAALSNIELEAYDHSDYYGVRVVERDEQRFLQPYKKQEPEPGIETIRIRVAPKNQPEKGRHALIVVYKQHPESALTRAGGGLTSDYSDVIGRTTFPTSELNHQKATLIDMKKLKNIGTIQDDNPMTSWIGYDESNYVTVNTTNSRVVDFTYDNQSIQEVTKNFNWGIGLNLLFPISKLLFNTSFNFSHHHTEFSSSAYEYMLAMRRVEKATVRFDMSNFDGDSGLVGPLMLAHNYRLLMALLNKNFVTSLLNPNLKATALYDTYGTDMISEGTFGGLYVYLYGRQENACGSTTGYDVSFNLGLHKMLTDSAAMPNPQTATTAQVLLYKYMKEGAGKVGGDAGFNIGSEDSEYMEATKSFSVDFAWGGGNGTTDAAWESGFDKQDNWALVSYSADAVRENPSASTERQNASLYPIHKVAQNILDGFKATFTGKAWTQSDQMIIQVVEHNIQQLKDAREDYILNLAQDYEDQPYVLADLMMVTTDRDEKKGHPDGEPRPIVRSDPFGVKRIYYPVMANDYAPGDQGYALEVGQPKPLKTKYYINDDNVTKCQYFYYALAPINETPGISRVEFYSDQADEYHYPGTAESELYIRRGESSKQGLGWKDNEGVCIYIHYLSEANGDSDIARSATFWTWKGTEKQKRIADTGGAELAPGGRLQPAIENEWGEHIKHQIHTTTYYAFSYNYWFSPSHWDEKNEYGRNLYITLNSDPLRIKSIKEIHQPKRWGEQ